MACEHGRISDTVIVRWLYGDCEAYPWWSPPVHIRHLTPHLCCAGIVRLMMVGHNPMLPPVVLDYSCQGDADQQTDRSAHSEAAPWQYI